MDLAELGNLADRLDAVRAKRLEADKIAASLRTEENELKYALISAMEANTLSSIGGKSVVVNRITKQRAIASSWPDIHAYIRDNDAFDILHRRLTDTAILLRKDDGIEIPGISFMDYSHITYSKART